MASGVGSYLGAQPQSLPSIVSTWCRLLQSRYPSDVPAVRHSQPARPLCSSGPELVNFIQLQYTTTHKIDAPSSIFILQLNILAQYLLSHFSQLNILCPVRRISGEINYCKSVTITRG
ncbi:hypothetical protein ACQJBY_005232 [Aegilops geniculata]